MKDRGYNMKPATYFYLTIEHDKVWVKFKGTRGGDISRPVKSVDDLKQFLISKADEANVSIGELRVMASSTLDFPDDFTHDGATITLARELSKREGSLR